MYIEVFPYLSENSNINIAITGYVHMIDASFDHEFGVKEIFDYEVEGLKVYLYAKNIFFDEQFDITDTFLLDYPDKYDDFKELLIDKYKEEK